MSLKVSYENRPRPRAIICDIDGTISEKTDRDIYDYTRVKEDRAIEPVLWLVKAMRGQIRVIFTTGRTEDSRGVTMEWLDEHGIGFYDLYMRPNGDTRCDAEVKQEIFEQKVKPKYDVVLALEDRKRVKQMWVQNNIFVLDVNQTDNEY